jgi:sec-independent protein translocase protein TatA
MIGGQEIFLVMIVALVLFGADKIPDLARTVGKGMREFKKASDDIMAEINESTKDFRKDISDITDSVKKDMDKVTGSIMNQVDDVKATVQENFDTVSNNINNTTNSYNSEAPYNNREVEKDVTNPSAAGTEDAPTQNIAEGSQNNVNNSEPATDKTDTNNNPPQSIPEPPPYDSYNYYEHHGT